MKREDIEQSLQRMYERGYKQGYEDALKNNKGEWVLKCEFPRRWECSCCHTSSYETLR